MIPKIIHYCWFGGNPLPTDVKRCIESWKKMCPDYEIKRWDESNFDVNAHPFTKAAYEAKAWAFVSDYARLKVVCDNGGIYLDVDYFLALSKAYAPIQVNQWGMNYSDKRIVTIGYPAQDVFFDGSESDEIQKITLQKYKKVILWMPTFRKGGGYHRNDSRKEQKLGIPLIETQNQYKKLNSYLVKNNVLLIIKIHPKQDLENLKIKDESNIKVLTGKTVKELKVDNYELMKCMDALISDYSGAAYDYLQLNRPIGYVLDDMDDYIAGFVVEDIHTLIAGAEIYNFEQLESFITDVVNGKDPFREKREKMRDYIHEYHDANSSKRLAELLGL